MLLGGGVSVGCGWRSSAWVASVRSWLLGMIAWIGSCGRRVVRRDLRLHHGVARNGCASSVLGVWGLAGLAVLGVVSALRRVVGHDVVVCGNEKRWMAMGMGIRTE